MQGETAKAKAAYQGFLKLWKGADPEIPILKTAKPEYADLQSLTAAGPIRDVWPRVCDTHCAQTSKNARLSPHCH